MEDFKMTISENKIYPRTGDTQTIYLKKVITNDRIKIGDYTMYNDFVHDPREFEKNNVLYHYPVNGDQQQIGFVTTARVPIIAPSPIVTPDRITASKPIQTSLPITMPPLLSHALVISFTSNSHSSKNIGNGYVESEDIA